MSGNKVDPKFGENSKKADPHIDDSNWNKGKKIVSKLERKWKVTFNNQN